MGHQIIQQPNGMLCVFSTNTDSIILADATPDQLADYYAQRAAEDARRETNRVIEAVLAGKPEKIYTRQFVMTYDEAVREHRARGGSESMV